MPQVATDGEPINESAGYGWSGSAWVKISVNASGEFIMANNLTPTSLAEGQVQGTLTTMYTVPASTAVANIQVLMYNSHSSTVTVTLSVTKSGSVERELIKVALLTLESYVFKIEALSAADLIRGIATTDDKVNYLISGQVQ